MQSVSEGSTVWNGLGSVNSQLIYQSHLTLSLIFLRLVYFWKEDLNDEKIA